MCVNPSHVPTFPHGDAFLDLASCLRPRARCAVKLVVSPLDLVETCPR
jgi:hypothetical protein